MDFTFLEAIVASRPRPEKHLSCIPPKTLFEKGDP